MKISNIILKNFRGIQDLELSLNERSTVLFGVNGVGKSSLLRSIDLLYANIIGKLLGSQKRLADMTRDDILNGKSKASITASFCFPSGEQIEYCRTISKIEGKKYLTKLPQLVKCFEKQYITKAYEDEEGNLVIPEDRKNMPVFVNYGVNRLVVDIPLKATKKGNFEKLSAFDKAIESKIDFSSLFEWFRIQEDLENQKKVRSSEGMNYENRDLKAVRTAMTAMLDGFGHIRIERQPLTMMVEKNGVSLNINQLSDGEKCTIALFGDLARRLAIANPVIANPLDGMGVVLIDELELHMHTQWQRKVLRVLQEIFPNIQFIVTTHSPQVLGEVNEDYNIIALKKTDIGIEAQQYKSLYGWDSNAILEEMMDTSSLSLYVKKWVEKMYDALEAENYNETEKYADLVDEITQGRNESVAKIRVLLAKRRRYEKNKEK